VVNDAIRRKAGPLRQRVRTHRAQIATDKQQLERVEEAGELLRTQAGWAEQHLRGIFATDRPLAARYRQYRREVRSVTSRIRTNESESERAMRAIDDILAPYLYSNDRAYQSIVTAARSCQNCHRTCVELRGAIRLAQRAAQEAISSCVSIKATPARRLRADRAFQAYTQRAARLNRPSTALAQELLDAKFAASQILGSADGWKYLDNRLVSDLHIGVTIDPTRRRDLQRCLATLNEMDIQMQRVTLLVARWCRDIEFARQSAVRAAHRLL
jgi:hypothetical protein